MSNTTEIICILDRSGSMCGLQQEVINNFNKFLKEQQSIEGDANLTLVLFDDQYEKVYDSLPLKEVPPLTEGTYFTRGMTAMNDAIGKTLNEMQRHDKAIVLIHTDGAENASKEYTQATVKTLTDKLKEKWEFIFAAGDLDKQVATDYGIVRSASVSNTMKGMDTTYANFTNTTTAYRSGGLVASANVSLNEDGAFADSITTNTDGND